MEENIIELLKREKKALTVYEINDALLLKSVDELKELLKALNNLEDKLKIYRSKKDGYMLFENSHLKTGTLMGNKKGFGFVDIDGDNDIFVAPSNLNGAIHGDKVIVEIISPKNTDLEGRIVRIVSRDLKQLVGEFKRTKTGGYIVLDDDKIKMNISIDAKKTLGAMDGHKVLVRVLNRIKNNEYKGEVIRIIGHKNDPGIDILSIVYALDINDIFSEELMAEVDSLPDAVLEVELKGRTDLRKEEIFTIDGIDTKDIDDAISIKKLQNGNYELGVHIADVSHYVKEDSKIDEEAYDRGTSVYLADRVIPMLPHKLSNGICSLNPNVDRLAISCVMEINEKGKVVNYNIFESIICSKKQMNYNAVNNLLEKNIVEEGYEEFVSSLQLMATLAKILRKEKTSRGYIDFDIKEPKIIVNDKGEAIDFKIRSRGIGENLIEDFMIAANETVASHIFYMNIPFVYRIHGEPNEEKIGNFLKFISILGYKINGKIQNITPSAMQFILDQLKDKKEYQILSSLLLRSMQKAVYDKNNIGHFGLASKCYTHFTSPIRRYPDLTVHRLLRKYLFNHDMATETINYYENKLPFLTEHSSFKERTSIECEREVTDMKAAEYMTKHIGEEYEGMISSVMSFGMFVELDNLIEGLIKIDEIQGSYYYDEEAFSLISRANKRSYRLGDKVRVVVKAASKENRTIDFNLIDKDDNTDIKINDVKADLLWTYHQGYRNFKVIPFSKLTTGQLWNKNAVWNQYSPIINQYDKSIQVGFVE